MYLRKNSKEINKNTNERIHDEDATIKENDKPNDDQLITIKSRWFSKNLHGGVPHTQEEINLNN